MSPESRPAVLAGPQRTYPNETCLHVLLEEQARRTPDAPALRWEGGALTYRALDEAANRVAHALRGRGVGPDVLVGVCMERSPEMVLALLGTLKAGGAYVPIDPDLPDARVKYMLDDARPAVVVCQPALADRLSPSGVPVMPLQGAEGCGEHPSTPPETGAGAGNLAYMIYTSGSTGKPKGAMNEHRGIVNRLCWMQEVFQLTADDRVLQKTPYSFDVSVWEFFLPLLAGATLVMARPGGHKDPQYLTGCIAEERITVIHFVPSMLRYFLEAPSIDRAASLRAVVCSGEALTRDLVDRAHELLRADLYNLYGPTEAAVDVTWWQCPRDGASAVVPIGFPIANTRLYLCDPKGVLLPGGVEGELCIAGIAVGRGYRGRPELTAERFLPDPLAADGRMYRTGDLARFLADGTVEYLGRLDFQVKIRGFRIELGEIEVDLAEVPGVRHCVVAAQGDDGSERFLAAYVVETAPGAFVEEQARRTLRERLPEHMVPSFFTVLPELPLLPNGKLDRKALPEPRRKAAERQRREAVERPAGAVEAGLAAIWRRLLGTEDVGVTDSFFDVGGNSLLALRLVAAIQRAFGREISVVKAFQYPDIRRMAAYLERGDQAVAPMLERVEERAIRQRIGRTVDDPLRDGVAVIGMAGRFPGAPDVPTLWRNLCGGVESITRFTREEIDPLVDERLRDDPDYVMARGVVEGADLFDAPFFGISPREAEAMDPQQRVFLELAWSALENAGYDAQRFDGLVGVFAGSGDNHYYPLCVLEHPEHVAMVGPLVVEYGNEKDYIATRVSYAMNLTGPSVSASTGCSTSLLAVDNAVRSLMDWECDMALAGGADIGVPQRRGFLYQLNGPFSRDGHCRPFDADASGTMFNDGAGLVVLKRLADALRDGDTVYAVIRGTAKNNDGNRKVSFLAPSVDGQAEVLAMAYANADVPPETVGYVEAHGTGTPLGDPIEIEALTRVFGARTDRKQFCRIGSIKGNIGHPTIASGIAGLIKAVLCLYHETIPATLHYRAPNPRINFKESPFTVVDRLTPWPRGETPRRAGVSSFGFGGTNVHVVLEEPPAAAPAPKRARPLQILPLSAKTEGSLQRSVDALASFLETEPPPSLDDAAATLALGRASFPFRAFALGRDRSDAARRLRSPGAFGSGRSHRVEAAAPVVFMFPGQGSQYPGMGRSLAREEPVFREAFRQCAEILKPRLGLDLEGILHAASGSAEERNEALKDTRVTQPALFAVEYALARLWMSWGVRPAACIGHSIGEFVAAALAEVFSLEDALTLVSTRSRLLAELPRGSMASVRMAPAEVERMLPPSLQLAASNSPRLCVVSGPDDEVGAFVERLAAEGVESRPLHTSHAFHSAMVEPAVEPFVAAVRSVKLKAPVLPIMSTVTAEWLSDAEAADPQYWGRHMRRTVRFSEAVTRLLGEPRFFLEVGPRNTLYTLTLQHSPGAAGSRVAASLSDADGDEAEWGAILNALGSLWVAGQEVDWAAFYAARGCRRVPLPTYAFESRRYWLSGRRRAGRAEEAAETGAREPAAELSAPRTPAAGAPAGAPAAAPEGSLRRRVLSLLESTSGLSMEGVDPAATTFLEMGMDSLFLTQIAFRIGKDFGVKTTYGQLMRDHPTIDALVTLVAGGAAAAPSAPAAGGDGGAPAPGARLGRDQQGNPAWFVPDPQRPGKYLMLAERP
jgi:amino acid adenylation domain-containing protein